MDKFYPVVFTGESLVQYLDREFRNGISFIQFYDFIQNHGVQFLSINEKLDTRSFTGDSCYSY